MSKLCVRPVLLVPFLALLACRDATGPCDLPFACQVSGVDLEISNLEVVSSERDAITGLAVVDADSIDVTFTVRNRGDSISAPTSLVLEYLMPDSGWAAADPDTLAIPSLRPGKSHQHRLTFVTWESPKRPRWWEGPQGDRAYFAAHLPELNDADSANNRATSRTVHVRVPVLQVSFAIADTALWINRPFNARVIITNLSRHGALPPASIGFRLMRMPTTTLGGPNGFGTHDFPGVPPSGRYERDLVLSISQYAAWSYSVEDYYLIVTIAPPGTRDSLLWRADRWLDVDGVRVNVHPDYEACAPAELRVDTAAVAPLVCTNNSNFYVFRFQPRTDREYSFEQQGPNPGATIYRPDGSKVMDVYPGWWLHFHNPETYYLIDHVWPNPPPTRTIVLRDRALTHTDDGGSAEPDNSRPDRTPIHRTAGGQR